MTSVKPFKRINQRSNLYLNEKQETLMNHNNTREKHLQEQKKSQEEKPTNKPPQSDFPIVIGTHITANIQNQHPTTTINSDKQQNGQTNEKTKLNTPLNNNF